MKSRVSVNAFRLTESTMQPAKTESPAYQWLAPGVYVSAIDPDSDETLAQIKVLAAFDRTGHDISEGLAADISHAVAAAYDRLDRNPTPN